MSPLKASVPVKRGMLGSPEVPDARMIWFGCKVRFVPLRFNVTVHLCVVGSKVGSPSMIVEVQTFNSIALA